MYRKKFSELKYCLFQILFPNYLRQVWSPTNHSHSHFHPRVPHTVADTVRQIISPYAIAAATPHNTLPQPSAPSSSRHQLRSPVLPDLLAAGQPRPSTSGRPNITNFHRQPPPPYTLTATPAAVLPAPPVYSLPKPKARPSAAALPQRPQLQQQPSATPAGRSDPARRRDDDAQNHSDHSGGSDVTFRMDELLYADAAQLPSAPSAV